MTIYISHELLYKKGMTNDEIAEFLKVSGYEQVICYADSAEPKSIEEIKRKGIYVNPARKGQGSVNAGISLLKEYNIFVSQESKNIEKEYHSYYWTELKDGTIVNKPVDRLNHCMDAMRYATFSSFGRAEKLFCNIIIIFVINKNIDGINILTIWGFHKKEFSKHKFRF